MTLIKYDPWRRMGQLQNDLNRIFDSRLGTTDGEDSIVTSDWTPAVDIREEDDHYLLSADIPGVDPKEIEVTMDKGILSIRGARPAGEKAARENYRRTERCHGTFHRRFSMPDDADPEAIEARGSNGVLEISIPKLAKVRRRTIKVVS